MSLWDWVKLLLQAIGLIRKEQAQKEAAVAKQKDEIDAIADHPATADAVAGRMRDGSF